GLACHLSVLAHVCLVVQALCVVFFFFFQAEDGIRDWSVTGVQTCALPIYRVPEEVGIIGSQIRDAIVSQFIAYSGLAKFVIQSRSEERRVGKECRSRWWAYH